MSTHASAPTPPSPTKKKPSCCLGCFLLIAVVFVAPILGFVAYINLPIPAPQPLPATWSAECAELEATWSIPTSREIGYEQLTISPWLMTSAGPYFLAQKDAHQVRIERRADGTLEAAYEPVDFWPFTGTAVDDTLWLIGEDKQGDPTLVALDAVTLAERGRVPVPASVIDPKVFHGAELVRDVEGLGLLLEPTSEASVQHLETGFAPLQYSVFRPSDGHFSAPITLPIGLELPDYPVYQRNPWPTVELCWLKVDQHGRHADLRLRSDRNGTPPLIIADVVSGGEPGYTLGDVEALERQVVSRQGDHHYHRHWTQGLQQPPVVASLESSGYHEPGYDLPTIAKAWVDDKRGGLEIQMQRMMASVTVGGLQLDQPGSSNGTIDVIDQTGSLTAAIQQELPITAAAPYVLAGFDDTRLLIVHVVLFPPTSLNNGDPILRLGTIHPTDGRLTWQGWIPFPKQLQQRILTLHRWRMYLYGDTLTLSVQQEATVEHEPKHERCPPVWLAARITLPDTMPESSYFGELECTY